MSKPIPLPPLERINELLDYDPATGVFRWKISNSNRIKANNFAGYLDSRGYIIISIDSIRYQAHRLAYYMIIGEQPEQIDHKNGIRNDNRFSNLRASDRKLNTNNAKKREDNKSGVIGVSWMDKQKLWLAQFGGMEFRKKHETHKCFDDFFEAVCCRKSWECQFGMSELKKHRK